MTPADDDNSFIEGSFEVASIGTASSVLDTTDVITPPVVEPQTDSELIVQAPEGGSLVDGFANQRIILPVDCDRGTAVQILSKQIPMNEFGLPVSYLRSDMLPYPLDTLCQGDVDVAMVKLDYVEGYPTTKKGALFWSILEHEPPEAFQLFRSFLAQAEDVGIRQLELLSNQQGIELGRVTSLYREYSWNPRAKSHDLFQAAADRKRRELRIRRTEDSHFSAAGRLKDELLVFFNDPEWINNLSPMEAIEALEKLMKIQRLSLGLTGQHSSSMAAPAGGESVEVIMRKIVGQAGGNGLNADMGSDMAALMADPAFGLQAQELIIRATRSNTPITTNQEASF